MSLTAKLWDLAGLLPNVQRNSENGCLENSQENLLVNYQQVISKNFVKFFGTAMYEGQLWTHAFDKDTFYQLSLNFQGLELVEAVVH